jgi:hypothetical protein
MTVPRTLWYRALKGTSCSIWDMYSDFAAKATNNESGEITYPQGWMPEQQLTNSEIFEPMRAATRR